LYVAVFNRTGEPRTVRYTWKELGLPDAEYSVRDLWEHKDLGRADAIEVRLSPHASALYAVRPKNPAQ
jgi:alpha-galactosidase